MSFALQDTALLKRIADAVSLQALLAAKAEYITRGEDVNRFALSKTEEKIDRLRHRVERETK